MLAERRKAERAVRLNVIDLPVLRLVGFSLAGLGLALTRRLAALHGGRIVLESSGVAGEGSTFTIEIPIASVGDGARKAAATEG